MGRFGVYPKSSSGTCIPVVDTSAERTSPLCSNLIWNFLSPDPLLNSDSTVLQVGEVTPSSETMRSPTCTPALVSPESFGNLTMVTGSSKYFGYGSPFTTK